ncbi:MAG: hypothetical protein ABSA21_13495 [Candidatus Limnocylindrales bacterium]|jgi:hypothetical protein
MKTDVSGGASADDRANDRLEERLSGRFAMELDRAELDYPALRERLVGSVPAARGGSGRWPKIALPVTAAACLAVAALVVGSLWSGSGTGPAVPAPLASGPSASGVVMSSDGIPTQIDGQRVYRVTDKAEWQNLSGSFLLGGYGLDFVMSCPTWLPQPSAEADLLGQCGGVELAPSANENPGSGLLMLAPQGSSSLSGWLGGPAIVVRVHTHDPEAAQCSAREQSACEAALVVEAVVWPAVPTEITGERVYRAADQASFPTSGSFLLGGPFTKPEFVPPCPMQPGLSAAEQQLIPYCYLLRIDGLEIAPESNIDEPNDEIVVARVHVNDPMAAQCPADVRAQCAAGIVVESVVWRSTPYAAATPTPAAASQTPGTNAASTPESGSTGPSESIGPDGVPTTLNGAPVYRAADLPSSPTFLLGGKLTRDTTCAAPATPMAEPPGCGYWMLDGVRVGTMVDIPDSLVGQIVVAQVERGRALAVCPGGSCTTETIVISAIVWPELPVATPPVPLTPPALPTPTTP